jgi:hypothetical protein
MMSGRKNNLSLRIGFLPQFQKEYGEDGFGFLFFPYVINLFAVEIINNSRKVSIIAQKKYLLPLKDTKYISLKQYMFPFMSGFFIFERRVPGKLLKSCLPLHCRLLFFRKI